MVKIKKNCKLSKWSNYHHQVDYNSTSMFGWYNNQRKKCFDNELFCIHDQLWCQTNRMLTVKSAESYIKSVLFSFYHVRRQRCICEINEECYSEDKNILTIVQLIIILFGNHILSHISNPLNKFQPLIQICLLLRAVLLYWE